MNSEFNFRNPSVNVHQFAMVPRAEIPRSKFRMQHTHKTTINASALVPIYCQDILPGDTFTCRMTAFCRLSTPLFPIMDNMRLESFFFFVPNRLVWVHWQKFCGEQDNPTDSISFSIPQITSPVPGAGLPGGWPGGSLMDYFGLPTHLAINNTITHSCLPLRAYNLIYHQWFRDENLQTATWTVGTSDGDGPDPTVNGNFAPYRRGKRHDYFTSCLPWTQKGGVAVTLPLGTSATVKTSATELYTGTNLAIDFRTTNNTAPGNVMAGFNTGGPPTSMGITGTAAGVLGFGVYPTNLYADLSTATAATINSIRLAFQTQKLLERDARGGTRYTEIMRAHFGVISPDMRLQRAELLGMGSTPVNIAPVAQTSATSITGGTTPQGTLTAVGTVLAHGGGHGFHASFTEHGYIIGLICVTADLTYQEGIRRHWSRLTRYDFYWPVFAALGEQAVLTKEIFSDGSAQDNVTFGFQERWAEYRYMPSMITGSFRSFFPTPLDAWHLAQHFTIAPVLGPTFIQDPLQDILQRNLALGPLAATNSEQLICDIFFDQIAARPMPMYSVPGLIDHF